MTRTTSDWVNSVKDMATTAISQPTQSTRMWGPTGCWRCGRSDHVKHDKATGVWCSATKCTNCSKYIGNETHDSRTCGNQPDAGSQEGAALKRARS
jgi:hypothetical protein